jgi:chromosome partitioning protein
MGRVVAVANQKGGVGKTTTSVNLGASLAVAERRAVVVDMDPQANASSGLGYAPGTVQQSIYDVMIGHRAVKDILQPVEELEYLHIAPSTRDLVAAEVELIDDPQRQAVLRGALEAVRGQFDYVLIDCPPSLGLLTLNALVAADTVVIPLQCEYYALEGLTELLRTIERVREAYNPSLQVEGILLTMWDPRNNLCRQVETEVREHFKDLVFSAMIPRNVRLSESPSFGRPVVLHDIRSKGCQAYLQLAHEVLEGPR